MKAVAGTKVTQTMYIHLREYSETGVDLCSCDMSKHDICGIPYICIGSIDVEYEIPAYDETGLMVDSLEKQLKKMEADHYVKTKNIKDQIASLLAITHQA